MPTSYPHQLNELVQLIMATNPDSLLDIGVGFGKYGFLAREYLELWDGREEYSDWTRRIEGIEVFADYLTPVHEYVYDKIHMGDACEVLPKLDTRYDLILLIDVLEHFSRERGMRLLRECEKHASAVLISIPKNIGHQGTAYGNTHEKHECQWRRKHFLPFEKHFFVRNSHSLICLVGTDAERVRQEYLMLSSVTRQRLRRMRWRVGGMVKSLLPFVRRPR